MSFDGNNPTWWEVLIAVFMAVIGGWVGAIRHTTQFIRRVDKIEGDGQVLRRDFEEFRRQNEVHSQKSDDTLAALAEALRISNLKMVEALSTINLQNAKLLTVNQFEAFSKSIVEALGAREKHDRNFPET